jgi:hypothetical protein
LTLAQEWSRCRAWIEAALEYDGGFNSIDDVERAIELGEAHFWPGENSAVVTQFWESREGKALHYWLCGGDLEEIVDRMQPVIDDWGRGQGCSRALICGRQGWSRVLKSSGYSPLWLAMGKEL